MSRFEPSLFERALQAIGKPAPVELAAPFDIRKAAVEIAAELCKRFEGFYSLPYLCPAGKWTIGYGATFYLDGRSVGPHDAAISKETATRLLIVTIEKHFLPKVLLACPRLMNESPKRLASILDWTFNLGAGNLNASTMRKRINAGEWEVVPAEIRKWNKAGGVVLKGLTIRRNVEADYI